MDFYPLGIKHALEKFAVGQRQTARIMAANEKMLPKLPYNQHITVPNARLAMSNRIHTMRPGPELPIADAARIRLRRESRDWLNPIQTFKRDLLNRAGLPGDNARADATLASGRHTSRDVVTIPTMEEITPETIGRQVGVDPSKVMYKGGVPGQHDPGTALWYSASPTVASGYVAKDRYNSPEVGSLRAYRTPEGSRWTPHVGVDTRRMLDSELPTLQTAGRSPVGAWPHYETVHTERAEPMAPQRSYDVGPAIAEYKPLTTPGKFMKVRGAVNPLAGDPP